MHDGFHPSSRSGGALDARYYRGRGARLAKLAADIAASGDPLTASKLLKVVGLLEAMAAQIERSGEARLLS